MRKILLLINILFLFSFVVAEDRNLPGIELITRSQWGADESRRYTENSVYQGFLKAREADNKRLEELKTTDYEKYYEEYMKAKEAKYKSQLANDYLAENFTDEYTIDYTNEYYLGHLLRQAESYNYEKVKIIIHHTASDYSNLSGYENVIQYMQDTYRFHAFTRGRGDIGYNFLIDPFGNIFEGRAGGEGVIATHDKWNNTPSVGIAMMGNFDIQKPTDKQIAALIKLTTALARKYHINPDSKVYYHKDSKEDPYITSDDHYALAGHKDAGFTSCPGESLYTQLPNIRASVKKNLLKAELVKNTLKIIKLPGISYSNNNSINIKASNISIGTISSCTTQDATIIVRNCYYADGVINISLDKKTGFSSGIKNIKIKDSSGAEKDLLAIIIRQSDLNSFIETLKGNYLKTHTSLASVIRSNSQKAMSKISHQINKEEAQRLMEQKINVLLYDVSTKLTKWNIKCDTSCTFLVNDKIYKTKTGTIEIVNDKLNISILDKIFTSAKAQIFTDNSTIQITNYDRKSYAGIPWNTFRGMLTFQKDNIKKIGESSYKEQYVVIDNLDFNDYLKGIVETNDTESIEKNKTMALVSKSYALFYMSLENKHPSIPEGVGYNAVDDPAIFQKFVGAGLEKTLIKWYKALESTKNQLIMYNGYVPILPYFNCSAGFTFSAKEMWGWIDTPYLRSRFDLSKCDDFNGHGVGLSGKGAEWRANHGFDYKQIINYYYDGVEIVDI